jgi:HK97 family phage portal protein
VGKAVAKHIRRTYKDGESRVEVNPEPYMRFLLEDPNPLMTMQVLQEKAATQLALNNNAFILFVRDEMGYPIELYPVPCTMAESINDNGKLYLKFYYKNGTNTVVSYDDVIHLRNDYNENDFFGTSPTKALSELMDVIGSADKSIKNAIKNSGVIRWLLKYSNSLRPEDLKANVKDFVDNYLNVESETFGAAGIDSKADAVRIEPKDYVPNAAITKQLTERVYAFFNTNEKIVMSTYNEDEWISYYEAVIEPTVEQMSAEFTRKLFTRRERGFGNKIVFESSNLTFASMSTKLALTSFADRAIMTPNEIRAILNLAPMEGGDVALLRKDTGTVGGGDEGENN